MKKLSSFIVLLLVSGVAMSQAFYNEWIDYSKTYYKFKVGATGLYRISATELATLGLGSEPAQNFILWRNGKQVALYTTTPTGPLASTGYIEFWGERNDGVTDKDLYRVASYQLSDKESLLSDTASFFSNCYCYRN